MLAPNPRHGGPRRPRLHDFRGGRLGAARAFYGTVLGWRFTPGCVEDGWQVEGAMAGLYGGHRQATTLSIWRVDDLVTALERVRAAGGDAGRPQTRSYGLEALCADDQGVRCYLGQP